jgi:hypothetical protein
MHHQAKGCIFISYTQVKQIYEQTCTKTGLSVVVRINDKTYLKGIKTKKDQVDYNRILTLDDLPQFNYMILT